MRKVVITDYWYESLGPEREILEPEGVDLRHHHCKTEDEVIAVARDADIVIVQFAPITRRVIESLERCRLIVRYAIGVDNIDLDAATERDIYVANVPDYCIDEVSTHAAALLLCLARKIPQVTAMTKAGGWDYARVKPVSRLAGKTLGILGFGHIGSALALKVSGFGLNLITHDPGIRNDSSLLYGVRQVDLETLFSTSDYISLHMPHNEKTHHILDDKAFGMMKRGVSVINVSRGKLIDEAALTRALDAGVVAAAALDVMEIEPFPADSPLRERDNVVLTPHFAWYSEESIELLQRSVAWEAVRVLKGQLPRHLVNTGVLTKGR